MNRLQRTAAQWGYDCCDIVCDDSDRHRKIKKNQDKLKSEMTNYANNAEGLLAEMMSLAEQMNGSRKTMIQKLLSTAAENIEMVKKML